MPPASPCRSFLGTRPVHDDLAAFLVACLSSVEAAERPLLLLGQPGSGKSVLTKFIAGRLPAQDFLAVRVVLRQTLADADVQTQIEDAVRRATGERVRWPALSRTAGAALRLVILDGFDELLQSIGVGQSSYLREVAAFQEREADQERPVAVIVTSRVAVADRAKLPTAGAAAVRLEPFRDRQIELWLGIDLLINVPPSAWSPESFDPLWAVRFLDDKDYVPPFGWGHGNMDELKRMGAFLRDQLSNDLLHAVDVFPYTATPGLNASFAAVPAGGANGLALRYPTGLLPGQTSRRNAEGGAVSSGECISRVH